MDVENVLRHFNACRVVFPETVTIDQLVQIFILHKLIFFDQFQSFLWFPGYSLDNRRNSCNRTVTGAIGSPPSEIQIDTSVRIFYYLSVKSDGCCQRTMKISPDKHSQRPSCQTRGHVMHIKI